MARTAGPPLEVPLTPSDDEARAWALEELAKAVYGQGPTLLERIGTWLGELWEWITRANGTLGPVFLPLVVLAVLALVVAAAIVLGGPVRRRRLRRAEASFEVLDGDRRTSQALGADADAAAGRGDYALAVLERFRAVVRSLDERGVLEDRQGRTAREAAQSAAERLPSCSEDLRRAARLFDAVRYGSARPGAADDAWLRGVARTVSQTRPVRAPARASPDVWTAAR